MTDQEQQQEQQQAGAFFDDGFVPSVWGVEILDPQAGQPPMVRLSLYAGAVAPGLFIAAKRATFDANTAAALGKALTDTAVKARSGLIIEDGSRAEALRA